MLREVDREPAVVLLQQPHSLAPQHFTQKHLVLLPPKGLGGAPCAPAYSLDSPLPATAPEIFALTAHRPPLACACPALHADAPHYIPDESGPARVAACAGWLPAAGPLLVSACDASVRVFRSARDSRLRCALARCPA